MVTLIIIGFKESSFIKVISILIGLFFVFFSIPILFIYFLVCTTSYDNIYENMHYYCEKHYEIYAYSAGAMDGFHYGLGKHYVFIDYNDIIYMSYDGRREVSEKEYRNYLNTHNCKLVGDVNEFK